MDKKQSVIKQKLIRAQESIKKKFSPNVKNTNGLTPIDINNIMRRKVIPVVEESQTIIKKRTIRNRPNKATRVTNSTNSTNSTNLRLLLDIPSYTSNPSIEWPVPNWFTFQGEADVSVIIPLYKSANVVNDLIQSWDIDNSGLKVEIIYVDDHCPNNSKNKVIEAWQEKQNKKSIGKILHNVENYGFAASCNIGAWHASGKYLIFLNADTTVTTNWIKPIVRLFKSNPKIGVVGNLQIKQGGVWDGTIDSAGSEWSWWDTEFLHIGRHIKNGKHLVSPMLPGDSDLSKVAEREMVTGCCMAFEKSTFMEMGGFDTNYRIGYWEDSDICLRFKEKGYKIMFQPNSKIFHKLSHSNSGRHRYFQHNKDYFVNKWINSGRIDPLVNSKRNTQIKKIDTILVQRQSARGDVLVASAIASALVKKYGCKVIFNTRCPEVLKNNPYINRIFNNKTVSERQEQLIVNLDMAYECRPFTNILEAYADCAGVSIDDCKLFIDTSPIDVPKDYIVIHAGKTNWAGRDWSSMKFDVIANRLMKSGENVVCIGGGGDHHFNCNLDLYEKTTISQLAYVIKNAKLFIGIDSFPMHVAQAVNTPGVVFFGSILGKTRIFNDNMTALSADVQCIGCHHKKLPPSIVTNFCENDSLECIHKLSIDDFWRAIESKIQNLHSV